MSCEWRWNLAFIALAGVVMCGHSVYVSVCMSCALQSCMYSDAAVVVVVARLWWLPVGAWLAAHAWLVVTTPD